LGTNGAVGKNAAWEEDLPQPARKRQDTRWFANYIQKKVSELSLSEVNMKILDYLTFMDDKYGHA